MLQRVYKAVVLSGMVMGAWAHPGKFATLATTVSAASSSSSSSSSSIPPYSCPTPPTADLSWPTPAFPLASEFTRNPTYSIEWIYLTSSLVTIPLSFNEPSIRLGLQFTEFFETEYVPSVDATTNTSVWLPVEAAISVMAISAPTFHHADVSVGGGAIVSTNTSVPTVQSSGVTSFAVEFAAAPTQISQNVSFTLVSGEAGTVFSRYQLRAASPSLEFDLSFVSLSPISLHGHNGFYFFPNTLFCGDYYYFSMPNLLTTGLVRWKDSSSQWVERAVEGATWWDHEWGTVPGRTSWVWSGIRLDSLDIMIVLPRSNSSTTHHYEFDLANSYIERRDNLQTPFPPLVSAPIQVGALTQVVVNRWWQSSTTQINYPIALTVTGDVAVSSTSTLQYKVQFEPQFDEAEACVGTTCFWEGLCRVTITTTPLNAPHRQKVETVYTFLELSDFALV